MRTIHWCLIASLLLDFLVYGITSRGGSRSGTAISSLCVRRDHLCANNKSVWSGANVMERVTRDQGKCRPECIVQNFNIQRRDHQRRGNSILKLAVIRGDSDHVPDANALQGPKESIPMTRQADISREARYSCAKGCSRWPAGESLHRRLRAP
jgi:hypothetical protein